MASTCCCSGGPDRGYSLSPGSPGRRCERTRPRSRRTERQPGHHRAARAGGEGQPHLPAGLGWAAERAAREPGQAVDDRRDPGHRGRVGDREGAVEALGAESGLKLKTGVTVSTLAAGGTRSVTDQLPDRTASTTSSRLVSTPGTAGSANTPVHDLNPLPVLVPAPAARGGWSCPFDAACPRLVANRG
jgi:hypothetical protein